MSEQFYDEEIAPVLMELAKKCNERGIPFVAVVEYEQGNFGTTADLPEQRGLPMDWAYVAARSNGNADVMIGHIAKQAQQAGHGSYFLHQLGVPPFPPVKKEDNADG